MTSSQVRQILKNIILAKPTEARRRHQCAAYSTEGFGTNSWFLPSCGQWGVAQLNRVKIDTSISATIGSDPLSSGSYWTSTQYNSNDAWIFGWVNGTKRERPKVIHIQFVLSVPMNTILFQMVYISTIKTIIVTQKKNGHHLVRGISDVCGIGISTDTDSFMVSTAISAQRYPFGGQGTLISNVPMLTTSVASSNLSKATHGFHLYRHDNISIENWQCTCGRIRQDIYVWEWTEWLFTFI